MPGPHRPLDLSDADAATAMLFPALLTDRTAMVFGPWISSRDTRSRHDLNQALALLAAAGQALVLSATDDLPVDDDRLIGALTLRAWSLGVWGSATRMLEAVEAGTDSDAVAEADAAAAKVLMARYEDDPKQFRRDGLDLLAGSLLTER